MEKRAKSEETNLIESLGANLIGARPDIFGRWISKEKGEGLGGKKMR